MNPLHPAAPVPGSFQWHMFEVKVTIFFYFFGIKDDKFTMRSLPPAVSSCYLTLMSWECEQGDGGKEGIAFEGSFRFVGCRSGSWRGLPMTKVTKEDNNKVCVLMQHCWWCWEWEK